MYEQNNEIESHHDRLTKWFTGAYNAPVPKPPAIIAWEKDKRSHALLNFTWPAARARRQLEDLSMIARKHAEKEVSKMLNFKPISEAENSAPHCFNLDPDGYTLPSALELRALPAAFFVKDEDGNSTTTVSDPRLEKLEEWIADPDHPVEETERTLLTLYASLAPAEYLYIAELVRVYDATRC